SSLTISTILIPDKCARTFRLASAAGIAALWGRDNPKDSTMLAMVDAVPITAQWPWLRHMPASASAKACRLILPDLLDSLKRHKSEVPISWPLYLPVNIGPPDTTIVGISTLQAPITRDGVVLSQPHKRTTPSAGLARMDSSTSILARLRYNIAVGLIKVSPNDITGNSTGNPPASKMPFFTDWARSRKWPLQGVSSDQVLQMPMTGLPSNWWLGVPWFFIHAR